MTQGGVTKVEDKIDDRNLIGGRLRSWDSSINSVSSRLQVKELLYCIRKFMSRTSFLCFPIHRSQISKDTVQHAVILEYNYVTCDTTSLMQIVQSHVSVWQLSRVHSRQSAQINQCFTLALAACIEWQQCCMDRVAYIAFLWSTKVWLPTKPKPLKPI